LAFQRESTVGTFIASFSLRQDVTTSLDNQLETRFGQVSEWLIDAMTARCHVYLEISVFRGPAGFGYWAMLTHRESPSRLTTLEGSGRTGSHSSLRIFQLSKNQCPVGNAGRNLHFGTKPDFPTRVSSRHTRQDVFWSRRSAKSLTRFNISLQRLFGFHWGGGRSAWRERFLRSSTEIRVIEL